MLKTNGIPFEALELDLTGKYKVFRFHPIAHVFSCLMEYGNDVLFIRCVVTKGREASLSMV